MHPWVSRIPFPLRHRLRQIFPKRRPPEHAQKEAGPLELATHADLRVWLKDAVGAGTPHLDGLVETLPVDRSPITREALDDYLAAFEVALQRLLSPLDMGPEGTDHASCDVTDDGTCELDLEGAPLPRRFRVTNSSAQVARGVRFEVAGRDWSTLEAMGRDACAGATDDRARAFAIYRFVRDNRFHGPPPTNHRDDRLAADPVSFFHHFGYGLCGNAANVFAVLCESVGLECRVWNIQGHTFPEVSFDGGWHVLDPDMRVFYPERGQPGSALAMAALAKRGPELLRRLHVDPVFEPQREELGRALADERRHRNVATGASLKASLDPARRPVVYDMLPGESLEFAYASRGPWYGCRRLLHVPQAPPREMAHVQSRVDLTGQAVLEAVGAVGFESVDGVLEAETSSFLRIPLSLPHPIVDAWLEVEPLGERLEVTVERAGAKEAAVVRTGRTPDRVDLRSALRGTDPSMPCHLSLRVSEPARFERLTLVLVGQVAPSCLPRFGAGPNGLHVEGAFHRLSLELAYDQTTRGSGPPRLQEPSGDSTVEDSFCFQWTGDADDDYEIQVSADEDFVAPVAPNFERRVRGTSWKPSEKDLPFLVAGRHYRWRVRAAAQRGQVDGEWSEPGCFRVGMASYYVRRVGERLREGAAHDTLGTEIRDPEWFADSAAATLAFLRERGLEPSSRVVDYGCGSLRLGASLIPFLEPGGYWGLDVTDDFYKAGLESLPPELVEAKRPRLSVLSPEELAGASAFGADLLVSFGVLIHVPEPDLPDFFRAIAQVLVPGSVGYVQFKEAPELVQTGEMTWSHPAALVCGCAQEAGLEAAVESHPSLDPYYSFTDGSSRLLRLEKS